jgi:circadian clock protein KaiC
MDAETQFLPSASTGVAGLDDILGGGLARNRLHLLEGSPGTGKTTIALQFLLAGAAAGEVGIYVSLAETEQELRDGARSHGWSIGDHIEIFELVPPESVLDPDHHQSLLYSSDLELGETIQRIFEAIQRLKPRRVVIDSLSEIRLLAQSSLRYRRQILALKHYFAQSSCTVIVLDDLITETTDRAVHSIAHSVVHLDQLAPIYGGERRRTHSKSSVVSKNSRLVDAPEGPAPSGVLQLHGDRSRSRRPRPAHHDDERNGQRRPPPPHL